LSPAQFKARLEAPGNFLLVNTHIPYEGEIAGTELFLPFNQVQQFKDLLPRDKSAEILLYCRSGRMSAIAAEALVKLGYTSLKNLAGGMIAWEQAGYRLVSR
jgi:rhodanese-related sulfurtransferase